MYLCRVLEKNTFIFRKNMVIDTELGIIVFIRSERAKRIHVRILSTGLRVSLPSKATQEDALKFIQSVRSRLLKKKSKLETGLQNSNILINENTRLQTLTFSVEAKSSERKNIHFSLKNNLLCIEFPSDANITDTQTQQHFWNGISYFLRKEAKRLLPDRTKQLADKFGFRFTDVKIQSSKTRWGSCSRSQSINLSLYLLLLPSHLIDYVILHELCHTKEMNHGVNFWIWMDRVTNNNSKNYRTELRKFHIPQ